jgi:hypothetical protein
MENKKRKINWRSIFAQAIVLSITIYTPFFLQNRSEASRADEMNRIYKDYLVSDLKTDQDQLNLTFAANQMYIDSTLVILSDKTVPDSANLKRRARITLGLGFVHGFFRTTDVEMYINHFMTLGKLEDVPLLRRLNELKVTFDLMDMVDKKRLDIVERLHMPLFLKHYSYIGSGAEPTNLDYFKTDEYLNTVFTFSTLAQQSQSYYQKAKSSIETVIRCVEGEEELKEDEAAPDENDEAMIGFEYSIDFV